MSEYQLEIKQIVDYPRCRIYRHFIQNLMADRSIRASGGSGLFYYTVLCNYANFRTSYLRIDGIGYTVYPGEWICTVKELAAWFRTRFQCPKSIYKLYPLSDACREEYISHIQKGAVRFGMTVSCGEDKPVYTFELTLAPTEKDGEGGAGA